MDTGRHEYSYSCRDKDPVILGYIYVARYTDCVYVQVQMWIQIQMQVNIDTGPPSP